MMSNATVYVVDDDDDVRDSLAVLLESAGFKVASYASALTFLAELNPAADGCLVTDVRMPAMDGVQLQQELKDRGINIPIIVITGHGDVPLAVQVMKDGALDFIEKPFDDEQFLASVQRAIEIRRESQSQISVSQVAIENLAQLTPREREVMDLLVAGHPNKIIGHKLEISPRTVAVPRGRVMEKMAARSLSDLVRAALAAGLDIGV